MISLASRRFPRPSSGTSMATLWADRSGSPSSSMAKTGCSSCPTTKASAIQQQTQTVYSHSPPHSEPVTSPQSWRPTSSPIRRPACRSPAISFPRPAWTRSPKGSCSTIQRPTSQDATLSNNYLALDNVTENKWQITERVDFVQSAKSSWFVRYSMQNESGVMPALDKNGMSLVTNTKQVAINNTFLLSPTLLNEFRFGFLNFYNNFAPELAGVTDVVKQLNLPGLLSDPAPPAWGVPNIDPGEMAIAVLATTRTVLTRPRITSYRWWTIFPGPTGTTRSSSAPRLTAQISTKLGTNTPARHIASRIRPPDILLPTSCSVMSPVRQTPSPWRSRGSVRRTSSITSRIAGRSGDNVTISYGVRYEYVPAWSDRVPLVNTWFPAGYSLQGDPKGLNPQPVSTQPCIIENGTGNFNSGNVVFPTVAQGGVCQARDGRLGPNLVNSDHRNFAPRFGIAWSPTDKWTVRVGAGVFYTQDTGNPVFDMARSLSGKLSGYRQHCHSQPHVRNPLRRRGAANPCGPLAPPLVCVPTPTLVNTYYIRQTPYVEEYELNVQRQLGSNTCPRNRLPGNARPSPAALCVF